MSIDACAASLTSVSVASVCPKRTDTFSDRGRTAQHLADIRGHLVRQIGKSRGEVQWLLNCADKAIDILFRRKRKAEFYQYRTTDGFDKRARGRYRIFQVIFDTFKGPVDFMSVNRRPILGLTRFR